MEHVKRWTPLSELVGQAMPVEQIVEAIRPFSRRDGLFSLCRIAGDLANADGGLMGAEARGVKWDFELRMGSP